MNWSALPGIDWLPPVVFAPFVGSFLGLVIDRMPAGRGVVLGRSACAHCGRRLALRDLLPVVSWLVNRGRCRFCNRRLSWFYPAIELAALAVALWSAAVLSGWLIWATAAFGWSLLTISWIDQRHQIVPDMLSLPLAPAGLAVAWIAVGPAWLGHLIGMIAGFGIFFLVGLAYSFVRKRQGLGLGDAKLLAGIGAWVAWQGLASVVLLAAVSGLTVVLLRRLSGVPVATAERLPFAPYLALGGWLVWLYGPINLSG